MESNIEQFKKEFNELIKKFKVRIEISPNYFLNFIPEEIPKVDDSGQGQIILSKVEQK